MSGQSKENSRFQESMNVKLLLRELCQYIDVPIENSHAQQTKILASKCLFALSQSHFSSCFNRISARIQEITSAGDESSDYADLELIQYVDLDMEKLTKLLQGMFNRGRDLYSMQIPFNNYKPILVTIKMYYIIFC